MKDFKFFQKKERVFSEWMDLMDDYHLGGIQPVIRWRRADGVYIPINELSDEHIRNIRRCLAGVGDSFIPNPYEGRTSEEWIDIMSEELLKR